MTTKRDYYEILNVSKGASLEEIKKAYREAALRYHPDRVPEKEKKEAEEKFKEISEAYAVLSDPQKRALYDQHGHSGIDQRYAQEDIFRGTDFSSIFQDLSDFGFGEGLFDKIFGDAGVDIFGHRRRKKMRPSVGRDLQVSIEITLEEAAFGAEKSISLRRYDICPTCQGTGAKPGTSRKTCSHCQGSGREVSASGNIRMVRPCPYCNGEGSMPGTPCPECQGEGRVQAVRRLKVTIPAGVDTGSELRLAGEGEMGPQGRGDLYLYIEVKPHAKFQRKGSDLLTEVSVPLPVAILGGEIKVPTLSGQVTMKVPPGTQNGAQFRLKGKGIHSLRGHGTGDEIVKVSVEIPKSLSPEQRKLIEEFARTYPHRAA